MRPVNLACFAPNSGPGAQRVRISSSVRDHVLRMLAGTLYVGKGTIWPTCLCADARPLLERGVNRTALGNLDQSRALFVRQIALQGDLAHETVGRVFPFRSGMAHAHPHAAQRQRLAACVHSYRHGGACAQARHTAGRRGWDPIPCPPTSTGSSARKRTPPASTSTWKLPSPVSSTTTSPGSLALRGGGLPT